MSEVTVVIRGKNVSVTLPADVEPVMFSSMLKVYKPFREWCEEIDENLDVRGLTVQSVDYFGARIGFLKFSAEAYSKIHGQRVPGIVFMRGGSVGVLPVLIDEKTAEKYIVLTEQARVPVGKASFLEIPAGMLDENGDVVGVAVQEMAEETGISLKRSDLCSLGSYYTSPGGSDELLSLYYTERSVSKDFLENLAGRLTGVGPHERIIVRLTKLTGSLEKLTDGKSLLAILLYDRLKGSQGGAFASHS